MKQPPLRRHLIIPDCQIRPGVDTTHLDWAAKAIVEYRPDVVIVLGDFWDMPSLSQHNPPGSKETEGANIQADIQAGNVAFTKLVVPMQREIARLAHNHRPRWTPDCHFLFGNHENRIERAISQDPKWQGVLSLDQLETPGFKRHEFLKIVKIDGISYCHYFPSPHSGRAIGGTILNRLNHIGTSFCQGHQQGFLYASKQYPDAVKHGIVCGRFYLHEESYRPDDVQKAEWNGILVLNAVRDGDYDLMPLRMDYLRRKYGKPTS